ncbi:MAG: hypothetical protein UHK99_04510, partial [Lacticaseibacillus paracasei]|nr:hypothetical protein [Lacticaseibacillus paracasei]
SRWKTTTDMVYLIGMADISRRSNPKTGIPALFRRSISVTTPKYFMTDRFVVKTTASNSLSYLKRCEQTRA